MKNKPMVTIFDQRTEKILSEIKDRLHTQPLDAEFLDGVLKHAKYYGKHGSLQGFFILWMTKRLASPHSSLE